VLFVYIVTLKVDLERPALGAVRVRHKFNGSFWTDLIWVLFSYIVMLTEALEGPALGAVCIHRKVKGSFWRALHLGAVYIHRNIKGRFGETGFFCCMSTLNG
jgi:hypothetical protein